MDIYGLGMKHYKYKFLDNLKTDIKNEWLIRNFGKAGFSKNWYWTIGRYFEFYFYFKYKKDLFLTRLVWE